MTRNVLSFLVVVGLCNPLIAQQRRPTERAASTPRPAASDTKNTATPETPEPAIPDTEPRAKVIEYGDRDVVRVNTKLRYTTLIVLPKNERILDFTCGDKEFWVVNGTENFASSSFFAIPYRSGSRMLLPARSRTALI